MTIITVEVNKPGPYHSLHKTERIPTVLSISKSEPGVLTGIESDIKILSAHRCDASVCITELRVAGVSYPSPKKYIAEQLKSKYDAIKIDLPGEPLESIILESIKKRLLPCEQIILNGDDITKTSFNSFHEILVQNSLLYVSTLEKIKEVFQICHLIKDEEALVELVSVINNSIKSNNLLITDCHIGETHINLFYSSDSGEFAMFKCAEKMEGMTSCLITSIAANLAHKYSLKEAIYGALEYVQCSIQLGESRLKPKFLYETKPPLEEMMNDEFFAAHDILAISRNNIKVDSRCNFFQFLVEHPAVKLHWERYINHDFVRKVADNTLPIKQFKFYIEQDFMYLSDFARIHCIAGAKAPEWDDLMAEIDIVNIIKNGVSIHTGRLEKMGGVGKQYLDNLERGPALKEYARYLSDVAKKGNWKELAVATMPCLMGYGTAVLPYMDDIKAPEGSMYYEWMHIYGSKDLDVGMSEGRAILQRIGDSSTPEECEKLARIYGEVCELEAKFWDAATNFE